jgi:hypothetical protein
MTKIFTRCKKCGKIIEIFGRPLNKYNKTLHLFGGYYFPTLPSGIVSQGEFKFDVTCSVEETLKTLTWFTGKMDTNNVLLDIHNEANRLFGNTLKKLSQ